MKHSSSSRRGRSRGNGKRHPSQKNNFESNGPDVKIRGTAQQVLEKYLALGRDATSGGDRVSAEAYFQHAEHYFRLINNAEAQNQNRQQSGRGTPQNGGQPADPAGDGNTSDNSQQQPAGEAAEASGTAAAPAAFESADGDAAQENRDAAASEDTKPRSPRRRGPGRPRRQKSDAGGEPPKEPASA